MKHQKKLLLLCAGLISGLLQTPLTTLAEINYTQSQDDKQSSTQEKTIEMINQEEGIAAEQIIVQISDNGYVTSHGDHYHYYNGEVPFDGIFSDALLVGKNYTFKEEEVITEVADGYVVLHEGTYQLYYQDANKAKNLRTQDEIVLQSYGVHPKDAKAIVELKETLELKETTAIHYELERTPEQVAKEVAKEQNVESEHVVVHLMEKGYVTLYGLDLYVFPKEVPIDAVFSEVVLVDKAYAFDEKDVVAKTQEGFIVKVNDMYKLYLQDRTTATLLRTVARLQENIHAYEQAGGTSVAVKPTAKQTSAKVNSRATGIYVTDDGYIFSPADVIQDLGDGFIVPHGDHFHFIPKADLTPEQVSQSYLTLQQRAQKNSATDGARNSQAITENNPATPSKPANHIYTTDDGYVFDVKTIVKFDDNGLVVKHDSHFHWIPLKDLSVNELEATRVYLLKHFGSLPAFYQSKPPVATEEPLTADNPKEQNPTDHDEHAHKPTPLDERVGKPNSQIIYSEEEIAQAKAEGKYTTSDGYIFDAKDIVEDTGDGYVTPHVGHMHWIPKSELSVVELAQALAYTKLKGIQKGNTPTTETKPNTPSDATPNNTPKTGIELYESVAEANIVPAEVMPYSLAYTTNYRNGRFIIPHHDHYHYVYANYFTAGKVPVYKAPAGYTLEQLFATIKYFINHPDERPRSTEGWGNDSDIYKEQGSGTDSNADHEDDGEEELDEYEVEMTKKAAVYGLDLKTFYERLGKISKKYRISWAEITYTDHHLQFRDKEGNLVHYDIVNEQVISAPIVTEPIVKKTGQEIYASVKAEKLVPLEVLPYNMAYATGYKDGRIMVPHRDHYHYVQPDHFTRGEEPPYSPPTGYTLEQLFATVKYLIEHPEERPATRRGWGVDSAIYKRQVATEVATQPATPPTNVPETNTTEEASDTDKETDTTSTDNPNSNTSETSSKTETVNNNQEVEDHEEEEEEDEEDEYEAEMARRAAMYGLDLKTFYARLVNVAKTYGISLDVITFTENGLQFVDKDGNSILYDIINEQAQ